MRLIIIKVTVLVLLAQLPAAFATSNGNEPRLPKATCAADLVAHPGAPISLALRKFTTDDWIDFSLALDGAGSGYFAFAQRVHESLGQLERVNKYSAADRKALQDVLIQSASFLRICAKFYNTAEKEVHAGSSPEERDAFNAQMVAFGKPLNETFEARKAHGLPYLTEREYVAVMQGLIKGQQDTHASAPSAMAFFYLRAVDTLAQQVFASRPEWLAAGYSPYFAAYAFHYFRQHFVTYSKTETDLGFGMETSANQFLRIKAFVFPSLVGEDRVEEFAEFVNERIFGALKFPMTEFRPKGIRSVMRLLQTRTDPSLIDVLMGSQVLGPDRQNAVLILETRSRADYTRAQELFLNLVEPGFFLGK